MTDKGNDNIPAQPENLRDARFAKALHHMPDAHMQASAQTRNAVLQEAMRAVDVATWPTPTFKPHWWQVLLGKPEQRVRWSTALASLAIVGFITVLWHGKEVPDATTEGSMVAERASREAPVSAKSNDVVVGRSDAVEKERLASSPAPAKDTQVAARSVIADPTQTAPSAATQDQPSAMPNTTSERRVAANTAPLPSPLAKHSEAGSPVPMAKEEVSGVQPGEPADSVARQANVLSTPSAKATPSPQSAQVADVVGAVSKARSRAEFSAAEKDKSTATASSIAMLSIVVGGKRQQADPEQTQALLALLRGLLYSPVSDAVPDTPTPSDLVVEFAGIERWIVKSERVYYQRSDRRNVVSSAISPAQHAAFLLIVAKQ